MPTRDPEKKKAQRKRWVEASSEQVKAARKKWEQGNEDRREKQREYLRAYRARQRQQAEAEQE
jgi:hypothetical protein